MENPTYGVSGDSRSNGLESTDEPEHLLINPLYTIATAGKSTLSPHATETDVSHTYKGIHETKTSERNNNSAWPYGPHPSVPSHLELGDPDGERENATLKSPGHEYATPEQPSQTQGQNHQKPQPYEVPVTLTFNRDTESVVLNGNHQYAKPESRRQILNYTK